MHSLKPPDYLPLEAASRLLPTTFKQVYHNCVSASIGDRLELQFTDDTPQWKRNNRAAAAAWWIRPLEERRQFGEKGSNGGNGDGGGGGGGAENFGGDGSGEGGAYDVGGGAEECGGMNAMEMPAGVGAEDGMMGMMENGDGSGGGGMNMEVPVDAVMAQAAQGGPGMFAVGAGEEIGNIPTGNFVQADE